jgi:hypothetical protein
MSRPGHVRVRLHRGDAHQDVALAEDLPLAQLLPWLTTGVPGAVTGLLDGARPLDLQGPGLAAQGVLDGTDLHLVVGP